MKYWQICPMNPTSYGDSPYQSPSAFAGNPYFIDLHELKGEGLLASKDMDALRALPNLRVDFGRLYENFWPIIEIAFDNFLRSRPHTNECEIYCKKSAWWLDDYALFMAIKHEFGQSQWTEWPSEFSNLKSARELLAVDGKLQRRVHFYKFTQWMFDRQWEALKNFANGNGISIIGDVPIFVGLDSADVWANRKFFKLRKDGFPSVVSGVPPDAFSETGQLWGNPVYNWDAMENDNFSWWENRIRRCSELYDVIRLDHFRGFCDYWEIPAPATTAANGKWCKSVGIKFFQHIKKKLPNIKFIAEDLGILNADVTELLQQTGLPGMSVLHFAFDGNNHNKYLPHEHEKNCTLYLGTHDNDTTMGWFQSLPDGAKHQVRCYLRTGGGDIAWDMIRKSYESPSNLVILTMQDVLNLDSRARFNRPNTMSGNWQWRVAAEQIGRLFEFGTPEYLRQLRDIYGR
jgi:4-alpha-glucanotransferase